ncbi:polysaccharide deacetylase family protein [Streptomyces caatingaensis]|uniref:Polysaccharide deacetylase n=1 Tax=Streptomyces caatingaensis TaxID=1678637 RepID=A0A0K9XAG7_9ACTN|nr:polysaccharide deacetylase family protein [Streptomyces caatingaensis]KNB49652.1 polysaccharide deacetylase [Streptomyces caatingaensis]
MTDTGGPVPILMYHSVAHAPSRAARGLSVRPEAFAEQMAVLDAAGFVPLTTRELAAAWRDRRPLPPKPVLITFDDGYEGVHRHALPVLAARGFPSTVFVSTGWLRGEHETAGALDVMLTWDQLRDLTAAGAEAGGHSHTHPQLDQLADARLAFEIERCRDILTGELGRPPVSFAYPYGYSSRRVRRAVRAAGFGISLAVGNGLAERAQGPYALRRVTVRRTTSAGDFERMVHGRAVGRLFAADRALTKGYAVVRGARRLVRTASTASIGRARETRG